MSKPWGGIGAWAADAERAEAEERESAAADANSKLAAGAVESQNFPSLKEAAATKPKKKKMTLSEFTTGTYVGVGGASRRDSSLEPKGLTADEMLRLPTGPKERTPEEMEYGRLGGGFRSYGRTGPPPGRLRDRGDDTDGSWGGGGGRRSYGGFDDERRAPPPRTPDFDQPSRADEVDNWAAAKKPLPLSSADSGRHDRDRYGSLGTGSGGSRADEADNWTIGKKPLPARSTSFGSGFRDSTPDSDRWGRGGLRDGDRERPRLVLDPPKGDVAPNEPVRTNRSNPFGVARPREEVLAEKGMDWRKLDLEIDSRKASQPTSSHSSRPSSAQSSRPESPAAQAPEGAPKTRPKINPFGDAKPREVLLEEKGKDWRKIDLELEHRGVDRPETEEEKMLKEEIDHLRKELEKVAIDANGESLQEASGGEQTTLRELILHKERDLELLIRDLDDKIRFGQKVVDRPGSGSGRSASFPERPPSQSSLSEESRSMEFMERPRSRGTGDVWIRPGDDRRGFQGGRERGFLGNRDIGRSKSRERW
ncbi:PREDICTED: eukaryotic translation initiation factor 4B2 [Nelumbo nucifera]|uniref:Eukaryotic translation initiation factor 4B2 n=1 Tax=Nelumbo nucifera TaxID=4432 RepID=A0A1U7ZK10_NELNU|nr:PREDICTED: eukaryotic translation initiation factor 4B2 [Nelumbo nucifera]